MPRRAVRLRKTYAANHARAKQLPLPRGRCRLTRSCRTVSAQVGWAHARALMSELNTLLTQELDAYDDVLRDARGSVRGRVCFDAPETARV